MYSDYIKNKITKKLNESLGLRGISWKFSSDFSENILHILKSNDNFGNYKIVHKSLSHFSREITSLEKLSDGYSVINGVYYFYGHGPGILSSSILKISKKEYRNYKLESLLL